jgi:hypothetical protein
VSALGGKRTQSFSDVLTPERPKEDTYLQGHGGGKGCCGQLVEWARLKQIASEGAIRKINPSGCADEPNVEFGPERVGII